nr:TetR/AcrR family transcriptional regulator [Isoptericola halotolerans]
MLAAAREIFAEHGSHAPLNAVARRAGVGQGSLYRHFPDRMALVLALFEEQVSTVERIARDPGVPLADLLGVVTRHAIESVVSIDVATASPEQRPDPRLVDLRDRTADVLGSRLERALAEGDVRPGTTVDDVLLGVEMVAATLTRRPAADRERCALRAWQLLGMTVHLPDR